MHLLAPQSTVLGRSEAILDLPGSDISDAKVLHKISVALKDDVAVSFLKEVFFLHYKNFFDPVSSYKILSEAFAILVASQDSYVSVDKLKDALSSISNKVYSLEKNPKFFNAYATYKSQLKPNYCYSLILDDFIGQSFLDFGSGNGYLSKKIKDSGNSILGADILNYSELNSKQVPFVHLENLSDIKKKIRSVDTTIAITVFHHIDDALLVNILKELSVVSRRVIIIEDVVDPEFFGENRENKSILAHRLIKLSSESKNNAIILGDFYGNVVTQKLTNIKLPFNFKKISSWTRILEDCGFSISKITELGFSEVSFHGFYQVKIVCDSRY